MGNQGVERTMELLRERVYWPTMAADATKWVSQCARCQVAQGNYVTPRPKIGHLEFNVQHRRFMGLFNPMNLLCLDFTKINPSRTGKENVLVITDAFSKFSVAVVTPNQKALIVAKVLVDKWFHVYGIPAHIHSNQGKCFDNDIIKALCKMYGVNQSFTCPYNPRGNAQCERFNHTMFGLLRTLSKEQKADWPVHLPALVFAYNATPHSTTGFQPYQMMFGRQAPAPCDSWLGLRNYDDEKSTSKIQWVDQQAERLLIANKGAMKNIEAVEAKNKRTSEGKDLDIPVGNLVLLRDHPEERNKIQDRNKSELYIVVHKGERPNNFWSKPLGSNAKPKEVNRRQIFDVSTMQEGLVERKEEEKEEKEDQEPAVPRYNPKVKIEVPSGPSHQYNMRPQPKPLPWKSKRVLAEAASIVQPDQQEVLVRNALLLQGVDAGTIAPQGVGDKQMMECYSQGSMGGDGVGMLQRVVKTDDPSSQGLGDEQMMESRSQCSMGKGDISWGHSSLSSPTRIHLVDGTQEVAEVTPELVTYF